MIKPNKKTAQAGFTIVELMFATTIFSVIILIAALTLIQVGKMFHKGTVDNQTQEVLRSAMTNITDVIQYGQGAIDTSQANTLCVGGTRYSYVLDRKVYNDVGTFDTATQTKYALVSSNITGPCIPVAQNQLQDGSATLTSPRELLGPNMSLLNLTVTPLTGNLYTVRMRIAYGDSDLRSGNGCLSLRLGGAFCSVGELETTVQKRTVR